MSLFFAPPLKNEYKKEPTNQQEFNSHLAFVNWRFEKTSIQRCYFFVSSQTIKEDMSQHFGISRQIWDYWA